MKQHLGNGQNQRTPSLNEKAYLNASARVEQEPTKTLGTRKRLNGSCRSASRSGKLAEHVRLRSPLPGGCLSFHKLSVTHFGAQKQNKAREYFQRSPRRNPGQCTLNTDSVENQSILLENELGIQSRNCSSAVPTPILVSFYTLYLFFHALFPADIQTPPKLNKPQRVLLPWPRKERWRS